MNKIPSLEEMLKLYTKKDLWERIQQHIQTIDQLKQQLAEKDKEIANLQVLIIENKNDIKEMREFKIGDNEYDLTDEDARNDIKCQIENQTQLAIQELEKVIDYIKEHLHTAQDNRYIIYVKSLKDQINKQIKELKGEKDVKD